MRVYLLVAYTSLSAIITFSNREFSINIPCIIDIEASGFGMNSYPIEVGVVRGDGARYCKLIKPFPSWTHWDPTAEKLHKIARKSLLENGDLGAQVCFELNEFIGKRQVYSDGWVVDSPWLIKLFDSAQIEMTFKMSPLEMILKEHQFQQWDAKKQHLLLALNIERHRASSDALLIQQTYIETLR